MTVQAEGQLKSGIEFSKQNGENLLLDAYVPEGPGPFPTCILVHGGGFTKGTRTSYIKPLFEPLSKAAFVWFTIDYRLAPQHRWPACADDVADAIQWVQEHAAEWKVDPEKIMLIGESAGGHLVEWAGIQDKGTPALAGVVSFYAPSDLEILMQKREQIGGIGDLLGLAEKNDAAMARIAEISPIRQVRAGLPPFLLIHGDKDDRVPLDQSHRFLAKLKETGNVVKLITIPEGGHGMGGWDKLGSDYQEQMIQWIRDTIANKS